MSANSINLNVLVKDTVISIRMNKTDTVQKIFSIVSSKAPSRINSFLEHVDDGDWDLCKFEQPILTRRISRSKLVISDTIKECQAANATFMELNQEIQHYFDSNQAVDYIHVMIQLPDIIRLNVLVENALVTITINNEREVKHIYEAVCNEASTKVKSLLKGVVEGDCKFQKLKQSVLVEYSDDRDLASEATMNQCKIVPKQVMGAMEKIDKFFQSNPEDQNAIHILIGLPKKVIRIVRLNVLVHNALVVDIDNSRPVKDIYEEAYILLPEAVTSKLKPSELTYSMLFPPVKYEWNPGDVFANTAIITECHTAPKRPMLRESVIANHFGRDVLPDSAIHVIIMSPEDAKQNAINSMERNEEMDTPRDAWKHDDIRELLKDIGCDMEDRIDIIGHPNLILITREGEGLIYMKYISHEKIRELEILQYLKQYDPSQSYILPFEHWDINGGAIVKFPRAGIHVTEYLEWNSDPTEIVRQLVETVWFLHEHNVAHRDIKPGNILVDSVGKVWIIDYSLARRVNGEDEMCEGFAGTQGWIAPEIEREKEAHSPIRADRWAVGYMIKEICNICKPWPQQKFLEYLSSLLMADNPLSRMSMQECYDLMKRSQQDWNTQQVMNVITKSEFMNGGKGRRPVVVM